MPDGARREMRERQRDAGRRGVTVVGGIELDAESPSLGDGGGLLGVVRRGTESCQPRRCRACWRMFEPIAFSKITQVTLAAPRTSTCVMP